MRVSAFGWVARSVWRGGSSTGGTAPPLVPPSRPSRDRTLAGGPAADGGTGGAGGRAFAGGAAGGVAVVTGPSTATGTTSSATWLSPRFSPCSEHNGRATRDLPV